MRPLGKYARRLQALREGEVDVYALLTAARSTPTPYRPIVMKYVAVAVHSLLQPTADLAGQFMAASRRGLPSFVAAAAAVKGAHAAFHQLTDKNGTTIAKQLNDFVRNRVSAHRDEQTVESVVAAHAALESPEFPRLFHATRDLIDALAKVPVWTHLVLRADGGVTVYRGVDPTLWVAKDSRGDDGFEVRHLARAKAVPEEEEADFATVREATEWSERVWRP